MSDGDTLVDGAATGGADTTKKAATTVQPGIVDSGDKPSDDAGIAAGTDTSADSGTDSRPGDTSNTAGQNDQPDNSTTVPSGRPGIPNALADAPGASSGK